MGKYKVGEVGWDEDDVPAGRSSIPFLQMEYKKAYKVRILSKPYRYYHHWVNLPNGKKTKVNCALENCPACGDEGPKLNRFIRAILKNDNQASEPCVLDIGPQIFKQLKDLSTNPSWGPLHEYDILLKKGKKGDNPLYSIAPEPKSKLTDADKAIATKINKAELDGKPNPDFIDLERLCQPWTLDKIKTALASGGEGAAPAAATASDDDVFGDDKKSTPAPVEKSSKKTEKKEEAKTETSSEDDNDFLDL